ncbi:hypothetical protein [Morganella morganii]|uniref:hypothetical protein n=1 Tax=Morganella morganii TaxID=582 RepID=UPI000DCE4025|nr:hypothetical protein [Morganella morganii]MBT0411884.1 hypothetical protein [Morganella morganii subsp. morganii]MBV0430291.1 hypothetical protein [Morganella morganii subsp. morganii]RAX25117.1 hypothetical protein DQ401_17945 [Morganella morganii]HCT2375993.1 hypothetical protein [Morganella morganii]
MIVDEVDECYSYRELKSIADEKKLIKVVNRFRQEYSELAKEWNCNRNSQWVCRIYFCTKMILNATVILKQSDFAEEKNLRAAVPYFHYYAMLSILRCVVLTLPTEDWEREDILSISHTKARNKTREWLARFDRNIANRFDNMFKQLKSNRELLSYKAPASGDENIKIQDEVIYFCTLLAEVAQLNTAILHKAVLKHSDPMNFVVLDEHMSRIYNVEIEGHSYYDHQDRQRLDYLRRKGSTPYSIFLTMTEGQTEDFIGAWDADNEDSEEARFYSGSPCSWQEIFHIP